MLPGVEGGAVFAELFTSWSALSLWLKGLKKGIGEESKFSKATLIRTCAH
jgi:hypothetical protein